MALNGSWHSCALLAVLLVLSRDWQSNTRVWTVIVYLAIILQGEYHHPPGCPSVHQGTIFHLQGKKSGEMSWWGPLKYVWSHPGLFYHVPIPNKFCLFQTLCSIVCKWYNADFWFLLLSLQEVTEGDTVESAGSWTQCFSPPTSHRAMVPPKS